MTETEWTACGDPAAMFNFVADAMSARRKRLFALACCREIWHLLSDSRERSLLEAAEVCMDLPPSRSLRQTYETLFGHFHPNQSPVPIIEDLMGAFDHHGSDSIYYSVRRIRAAVVDAIRAAGGDRTQAWARQCASLRDIAGNPFRDPIISKSWLSWNENAISRIAQEIDTSQQFDRLPILADALEEAGCTDAEILEC